MKKATNKDLLSPEIAGLFEKLMNDFSETKRFSHAETKTEMWSKVISKVRKFSESDSFR